jgi:phosphoribosyl 1,2-cyclic phosphate phosphodiesterase
MIGCTCATCRSDDPRDRRWRPSIYVELDSGVMLLVDTSPDLRAQVLEFHLPRVDAILFTHSHADHVLGLDEVRRFNALQGGGIPCYGDAHTISEIRQTFSYVFSEGRQTGGGLPQLDTRVIDGPFELGGTAIVPVPLLHGRLPILGFRIGRFAYLTDCSVIPDTSWPLLDRLDVVVLDALRDRPHPTHFSLSEAIQAAAKIAAGRTYFTHICHDLPHQPTMARLPAGVELAYDGLSITI